jgi:hypothetical protein
VKQKDFFTLDRLNNVISDSIFVELKFDVLRSHPGTTTGKPEFEGFPRNNTFYYMFFK